MYVPEVHHAISFHWGNPRKHNCLIVVFPAMCESGLQSKYYYILY